MATLVYLPDVNPNTWLHWSSRNSTSCLRDFTSSPASENRKFHTAEIRRKLEMKGGKKLEAPRMKVENHDFWSSEIRRLNIAHRLGNEKPTPKRLLDRFVEHIGPLTRHNKMKPALRCAMKQWPEWLTCVKTKPALKFNDWDIKNCENFKANQGEGWSSGMLEYCRNGQGNLRFIETEDSTYDFAVIGREVGLSISKQKNRFQDAGNRVELDAVAVRRNNRIGILEIKGPQDDGNLIKATLQAFLGTLAVYAKREMVQKIARNAAGRRSACPAARIPKGRACLGVYVIVADNKWDDDNTPEEFDQAYGLAQLLLDNCKHIDFMAYFRIKDHALFVNVGDAIKVPLEHVVARQWE